MPRVIRRKSSIGIYHVMLRGINKQMIFLSDADNLYFLKTLEKVKQISDFALLGFCLMGNHLHLLIQEKESGEPLDKIMQRILNRFIAWYNPSYNRCGPLFCGRFRSETVEDERYFLTVLRYIHNNPVHAGLCRKMADYKWSSFSDYADGRGLLDGLVDTEMALSISGKNELLRFFAEADDDLCMDDFTVAELEQARQKVCELIFRGYACKNFDQLAEDDQKELIKKCKEKGISKKVISEITGASTYQLRKIEGMI